MVTLSHAERRPNANKQLVRDRLRQLFDCRAILVAKENHSEGGYHLHAGVRNRTASKNTATKKIREVFQEARKLKRVSATAFALARSALACWEGGAIDVRFHRDWASICRYILKEDKEPLVWGEYTRQQIIEIAGASPKLKRSRSQTSLPEQIIDKLLRCQDWYEFNRAWFN
jgi:hypothetical protein